MIVVFAYLGFTKDIPFTTPFQVKAVFENAPPIHKNEPVRIAGVEVGRSRRSRRWVATPRPWS